MTNEVIKDTSNNLADNLQTLLKAHNLSINQLARILDIPMMTVWRLTTGETNNPRISTLQLIAEYFHISIDLLIGENNGEIRSNTLNNNIIHRVPLLDWDTIEQVASIDKINLSQWKHWQSVCIKEDTNISKSTFALKSRPSIYSVFPMGTIFIIDPNIDTNDGDIVLIKIRKNNTLTMRRLSIDPPEWHLESLSLNNDTLKYSDQKYVIIGAVFMTVLYTHEKVK